MNKYLKKLQSLGQEYDSAHQTEKWPIYSIVRPLICLLLRHKMRVISTRQTHGDERAETGCTAEQRLECQCGREYWQYIK